MNRADTRENWQIELEFIQSVRPTAPGPMFNNDPACFGRYALMQSNQAERQGYADISADILLHALEVQS